LNEAIDSILNQTFSDFEFLIIDDGSTDQSIDQIMLYDDPRIQLIKNKKNLGQSETLNKGINLARGKYIARMDQDDISMPKRLEKQLKFMEDNPQIGVCGSWLQLIGKYKGIAESETEDDLIKIKLLTNQNLAHPSVMIRKEILEKYELSYGTSYTVAQDYDLWVRMFDHCSFANLPKPLLKYRIHENQKSRKVGEQNSAEGNKVLTNLLIKMGLQLNDSDLIIHNKIFSGIGINSVTIDKALSYLIRLRSSNIRKKVFEPVAFNEFLKTNWRRLMFKKKHKLLYWVSVLIIFRPANFIKIINNRFSLIFLKMGRNN
jgi:glycosyltransferase involved in cell wall biosynthesis